MARQNKCNKCGWNGQDPQKDLFDNTIQEWVGTNHNLCNLCVKKQQREEVSQNEEEYLRGYRSPSLMSAQVAAMACMIGLGAGPLISTRRGRR